MAKEFRIYVAGKHVEELNSALLNRLNITGTTVIKARGYWFDNKIIVDEESTIIELITSVDVDVKTIGRIIKDTIKDQDAVLVTEKPVSSNLYWLT